MTSQAQAVSTLCAAAAYLRVFYHSEDCKRNEGWGKNYSQRGAYDLLLRLAREVRDN